MKGEAFDGNAFAPDALKKGAALAVVDDPAYQGKKGYFLVKDVLETLQQLANYHRNRLSATFLAITGSNLVLDPSV